MKQVAIVNYGSLSIYANRKDALDLYTEAYYGTDPGGAENERYAIILEGLLAGENVISDNYDGIDLYRKDTKFLIGKENDTEVHPDIFKSLYPDFFKIKEVEDILKKVEELK